MHINMKVKVISCNIIIFNVAWVPQCWG